MRLARRVGAAALMAVLVTLLIAAYADDTPMVVDTHQTTTHH